MSKHGITVEAIMTIPKVDRETAEKVVAVLDRWATDRDYTHEDALRDADELLDTSGVEAVNPEGAPYFTDEGIRMCPPFSYCNAGDPYVNTLVRDHENHRWLIAGWADCLEMVEKEHKLGDHEEFEEQPDQCPSCHGTAFTLGSYEPGAWEGMTFVKDGTVRYYFACESCNHHCQTPEDWTPPEEESDDEEEEEDPEAVECSICGEAHNDDNHNHQ